MQIYHDWTEIPSITNLILTIGVFDGVHLGHQAIFRHMSKITRDMRGETLAFTFERNPLEILTPSTAPKPIVDLATKVKLIQNQNIDHLLIQPFSTDLAELTAHEFVQRILIDHLQVHTLVLGSDFRFGKRRQGDLNLLQTYAQQNRFDLVEVPFQEVFGQRVSSTKTRQLLSEGKYNEASQLLGWNYASEKSSHNKKSSA